MAIYKPTLNFLNTVKVETKYSKSYVQDPRDALFLSTVKDVEPIETHVEVASEPINESSVQEVTPVNNPSEVEDVNPYVMALSKEQTIRLDDEMLARFEDLTAHLKNVLITLGYSDEIDGTKSDNLIKLLTSGVTEEREILYYTLTYNKNLTDEEKVSIYNAIDNELKLTNNGELSL